MWGMTCMWGTRRSGRPRTVPKAFVTTSMRVLDRHLGYLNPSEVHINGQENK